MDVSGVTASGGVAERDCRCLPVYPEPPDEDESDRSDEPVPADDGEVEPGAEVVAGAVDEPRWAWWPRSA